MRNILLHKSDIIFIGGGLPPVYYRSVLPFAFARVSILVS